MNTQQKDPKRQSMFADMVVETPASVPGSVMQERRMSYLKLVYSNGVSLVLPGGMAPMAVMEYINSYRP